MAIEIYLYFNGNCREAVEYYSEVFKVSKQQIMTYGDTPSSPDFPLSEEAKDLVLHTFLIISGSRVMFSDVFPEYPFVLGSNMSITIVSHNMDELKSYFNKLSKGGSVSMDPQETFWSKYYAMLTDKFGVSWQLSYEMNEGTFFQ